jgi:hypothetical protein
MLSIGLAWLDGVEMRSRERTNDSHIDGETTPEAPVFDGDITRSTT